MNKVFRPGQYHEPSGQVGFTAPFWMLSAAIGAVVAGALYGYVSTLIGNTELRIGCCVVFSCIVGILPLLCANSGKIRSLPIVMLTALLCGIIAEYVSLVSWIYALTKQQLFLFSPADILNMMEYMAIDGVWTIGGDTPVGIELYGMWSLEALGVIGVPLLLSWKSGTGTGLFCDNCNEWITSMDTIWGLEPIVSSDKLVEKLESGDFDLLESLEKAEPDAECYWTVTLSQCNVCQQSQLISVDQIGLSTGADGTTYKSNNSVIDNLIVPFDVAEKLKDRWLESNE